MEALVPWQMPLQEGFHRVAGQGFSARTRSSNPRNPTLTQSVQFYIPVGMAPWMPFKRLAACRTAGLKKSEASRASAETAALPAHARRQARTKGCTCSGRRRACRH